MLPGAWPSRGGQGKKVTFAEPVVSTVLHCYYKMNGSAPLFKGWMDVTGLVSHSQEMTDLGVGTGLPDFLALLSQIECSCGQWPACLW
jgi:hypothetical protein